MLDEDFGNAPLFVCTDPRDCRIARSWLDIFAERGITPKIVLLVRLPLEVARSGIARDSFKGLLLCYGMGWDAEAAGRDLPRIMEEYHVFLKDWRAGVA